MSKTKKKKKYIVTDVDTKESVEIRQVNYESAAKDGIRYLQARGEASADSGGVTVRGPKGTKLGYGYMIDWEEQMFPLYEEDDYEMVIRLTKDD